MKDSGFRIRVETHLRDAFVKACQEEDQSAAQVLRTFMRTSSRRPGYVVALRAVHTSDFMTAQWAELPHALLGRGSNRIINEVRGINRVVYDISSKPPATIEWE